MDNFENTPNTPQNPSEQVESTVITPPAGNAPASVVSQKPKSKKNLLEIGILFVIVAILAGIVSWYFISKNQTVSVPQESETTDQITSDTNVQPTLLEVTPTMKPRELKILADCKMHNVNPDGSLTVLYEKDEFCGYGNRIIDETQEYIDVWNNEINEGSRKLLRVSDGTLVNLPQDFIFGYYNPTSKNFYTRSSGSNTLILYKGQIDNLKGQKILEFENNTGGRGIMAEDDFYFVPNQSETHVIYQDTTTTGFLSDSTQDISGQIGAVYGGMAVYSMNGNKLIELGGAFRTRWLNDYTLVTLVRNNSSEVLIRKYTISEDGKYNYVDVYKISDKNNFGEIYNIDIYGNSILLNVYSKDQHNSYFADLSGDRTTLISYMGAPANAKFLDSNSLLGYGLIDCDPSQDFGGELACPIEWVFDDYKSDIRIFDTETKEIETLLELDDKYLL